LRFQIEDRYFRVAYTKLSCACRLSNEIRLNLKFVLDADNRYVFALWPEFETLSDESFVGNEWEALDEGTAIICKPGFEDVNGYYDMIRERVKVGSEGWFVAGSEKFVKFKVLEIINAI